MLQKVFFIFIILIGTIFFNACTEKQINDAVNNVKITGQVTLKNINNFISNESVRNETKMNMAGSISEYVKQSNLKKIEKFQTYEEYINMVDNLNLMIDIINKKTGASIKMISKDVNSWNKFSMEVTRYTPLVKSYNNLVDSCYVYDKDNEESANQVLIKTSGFTAEIFLIFGTTFYKTAYGATGTIADATGITKLTSLCGPCVSAAMSAGHWTIRNGLVEKTTELVENATSLIT